MVPAGAAEKPDGDAHDQGAPAIDPLGTEAFVFRPLEEEQFLAMPSDVSAVAREKQKQLLEVRDAANAEISGYKAALAKAQQFKQEFDQHARYVRENYVQKHNAAPPRVARSASSNS